MAERNEQDRTEPASQRKRDQAREEGNFAHSPDLAGAVALVGALMAMGYFGSWLMSALVQLLRHDITNVGSTESLRTILTSRWPAAFLPVAVSLTAILGVTALASLVCWISQAGLHFNMVGLEPKWERVDPMAGFKQLASVNSLVHGLLGVLKLAAVSWIAFRLLAGLLQSAGAWWQMPAAGLLPLWGGLSLKLAWSIAIPLLLIAIADFGYKKWRFEKDLMMTQEEMREENKQMEGDPQIKARIRQIQRLGATRRMMQEVPKATVIIANPTHVAIALRYEAGVVSAPVVIAKGENLLAQRIKAVAAQHGVPIIEDRPLARALLKTTQIGQEIPFEFYRAVAEILALLYKQRAGIPQGTLLAGSKA